MGGVPGRSKACRTCRRRKKGCDLEVPSCGQCRKACIPCEGYSQDLTVHQYKKRDPSVVDQKQVPPSTGFQLTTAFSRTAYETGIQDLFWESYLPNKRLPSSFNETYRTLGGSLNTARNYASESSLLRAAFGAMALRTISNKETPPCWMREKAMQLLVTALKQMGQGIDSRKRNPVELLCATRIFSFYEALYGSDFRDGYGQYGSWRVHHTGDLAIIVSQVPSYYSHGPAHRLFIDGRLNHVLCALMLRKRSVLGEPQWRTEPWTIHPKTPKDILIDILMDIGGLYEDTDSLRQTGDSVTVSSPILALHDTWLDITERLGAWRSAFATNELPSKSTWESPGRITEDDLANAHVMTLYWAITIVARSSHPSAHETQPMPPSEDLNTCCRNIIRCIPLFIHPATGVFRQHLMPFPVMVALGFLKSTSYSNLTAERDYLSAIHETAEFREMRKFMLSLQPDLLDSLE